MIYLRQRTINALTAVVAAMSLAFVGPAQSQAVMLSISGGTPVDSIPQGVSGNFVLPEAGIGMAGGQIFVDGILNTLSSDSHAHSL